MTEGAASAAGVDSDVSSGVLRISFDRPDALNALSGPLLDTVSGLITEAAEDASVRVILLTGAGRAFSADADLGVDGIGGDRAVATLDAANSLVSTIVSSPRPVVAAVNGLAAGVGATIALACDLTVVRRSAYFLLAFANVGLMPDGGATAIVPAAIGRARVARLAFLAEKLPAADAYEWGLISHLCEDNEFDDVVADVVGRLASGPTAAYARTKEALRQTTVGQLASAQARERDGQLELFATADFAEGVTAFRERRPARFVGR